MKKIKFISTIAFLLIGFSLLAQEQAPGKHPKVIEVEMSLTKEASSFLQQQLPDQKIFVNVEVEPLKRKSEDKNEKLPYFYNEDEISDEWDAVDTPTFLLISRIKKATIKIEVPTSVSDSTLADLKERLLLHLKLIPGRDVINFEKKSSLDKASDKDFTLYYFMSGMTLLILGGLFFSIKYGLKSLPKQSAVEAPAASVAPAASAARSSSGAKASTSSAISAGSKIAGDINFKDSLKAAELIKEKLLGVVNAPVFPTLSDLLIMDELSNKSLSSFGALVCEIPRKQQQKVFFRSKSEKWFKGYIEASSVDLECFMAVEKMLRNRTLSGSEQWEELIIQTWRLGDEAAIFLKQIPMEDAMKILAFLPKYFSVPTAKKSFPGAWAKVLDQKELSPMEDTREIEKHLEKALQIRPYFSFKSIDDYKKDLELTDYLRIASVKDEEEVYESLNPESVIFNLRPPFYKVMRSSEEQFKEFFTEIELTDWALALFNAPREYSELLVKQLDDKKRYLYKNMLKDLDENGIDPKEQSEMKESIALKFKYFIDMKKANNVTQMFSDSTKQENEKVAA